MFRRYSEIDPMVDFHRREYLEFRLKIPPKIVPEGWARVKRLRDTKDKAVKYGKLPECLPESIYGNLASDIRDSLIRWQSVQQSNDSEISEQARKRIRKAWEALHVRMDRRERINVLELWHEYYLEQTIVANILKILRHIHSSNGVIEKREKTIIAIRWDLTEEEVNEIWRARKTPKRHIKERLGDRYQLSVERLNRLLPRSRKFYVLDKQGTNRCSGTLTESLRKWSQSLAVPFPLPELSRFSERDRYVLPR